MIKPGLTNFIWLFIVIVPNFLSAIFLSKGTLGGVLIGVIGILIWLAFPCSDKRFGKGRSFHWVRQTALLIGGAMTLVGGLVFGA